MTGDMTSMAYQAPLRQNTQTYRCPQINIHHKKVQNCNADLSNEWRERFSAVKSGGWRVVEVNPFTQQVLGLLMQTGWIIKLAGLYDAGVHHWRRSNTNAIYQWTFGILPQCLQQRCQSESHTHRLTQPDCLGSYSTPVPSSIQVAASELWRSSGGYDGEDYKNCSVLCCVQQLCIVIRKHLSSSFSCISWFKFRFLFCVFV